MSELPLRPSDNHDPVGEDTAAPTRLRGDRKREVRSVGGIPLRALLPNMVTALALCIGLSSVWLAFSSRWEAAVTAILVAGLLDGMDGRIARMLRGTSRFGAELDSLSDNIAFGVCPALVTFIWSLQYMPKFGWTISLFYALCCALRLARFNASIDDDKQPHRMTGFLTGVPAPAGAAIALLPLVIWLAARSLELPAEVGDVVQNWWIVGPWLLIAAILMISSIATFSSGSLRLRRNVRFEAIVLIGFIIAAMITAPWLTLVVIIIGYIATIPFSLVSYRRARARLSSSSLT